ncbi:MAG: MFS transporter [Patescibacteria group bacterium]|nr:MFS transporter [Patescibacteria group bacterium]
MQKKEALSFIKTNRNFNLLWASQILSQITVNMINFVMATRIYEKTGSTLAVSFLWVFYAMPAFFLGPFSGFLVDLWSRRKTLLYSNFLQGVTMLMFLLIGNHIYLVYPIVFLYSLLNQFYNPAEAASIPWLVKKKDLPMANSLFLLTAQSALVFGLGFSGILMRLFGKNNPVILSAVSLFAAALAVYFLPQNEPGRKNLANSFSRFLGGIRAGYLFVKNTKIILFPLLLMVFFQVFLVILGVTIPGISRDILNIEIQDAGPLLIMPIGIGALLGALFMTRIASKFRKRVLMKNGFWAVFGVLLLFSLLIPLLGQFKILFAIPLMLVLGLAGFFIVVPNQTLVQENTPPQMRGRVYGTLGFFGNLITLPCLLFTASIVDIIGSKLFVFVAALIVLLMILTFDTIERYILAADVKMTENPLTVKQ